MDKSFENAICINGSFRETYTLEELGKMCRNDRTDFAKIKDHLFCPECNKAKLVFHHSDVRQDYLSASSIDDHASECSYKHEKAPKKILEYLSKREYAGDVHARLESCLLMLFKQQTPSSNPFVISQETSKNFRPETNAAQITRGTRYRIPKRSLARGMDESCIDGYKIYYGKAELKWCRIKVSDPPKLYIYHAEKGGLICSLAFPEGVYEHLPTECKETEHFHAIIAFYAELKQNKSNNRIYYNGRIKHSDNICFDEIAPID